VEGNSDANDAAQTESHPTGARGVYIAGLRQISMDLTIRPMHIGDISAGLRLCRLSCWNQLEEDWLGFLGSPVGGGWLAEREGTAVGTVTFLRYGRCFSWLSMMLVDPDARRAGIATCLLDAALGTLAGETCVCLDATPLGEPLYRRFGFSGEYELVRAKVAVPSGRFSPLAENARPMGTGDLAEVFTRDREVFGADRSVLLASFYHRAPDLAWTMHRGGTLLGYCFGRPGYLYRQLGPVVAEDADVARDIVSRCLAGQPGEELAVDVPRSARRWIAWLESVGFLVERPFLRMGRGRKQCPELAAQQFAIAGPEFG
jgi:GNAT superfamily N-acetyltransferase